MSSHAAINHFLKSVQEFAQNFPKRSFKKPASLNTLKLFDDFTIMNASQKQTNFWHDSECDIKDSFFNFCLREKLNARWKEVRKLLNSFLHTRFQPLSSKRDKKGFMKNWKCKCVLLCYFFHFSFFMALKTNSDSDDIFCCFHVCFACLHPPSCVSFFVFTENEAAWFFPGSFKQSESQIKDENLRGSTKALRAFLWMFNANSCWCMESFGSEAAIVITIMRDVGILMLLIYCI